MYQVCTPKTSKVYVKTTKPNQFNLKFLSFIGERTIPFSILVYNMVYSLVLCGGGCYVVQAANP